MVESSSLQAKIVAEQMAPKASLDRVFMEFPYLTDAGPQPILLLQPALEEDILVLSITLSLDAGALQLALPLQLWVLLQLISLALTPLQLDLLAHLCSAFLLGSAMARLPRMQTAMPLRAILLSDFIFTPV